MEQKPSTNKSALVITTGLACNSGCVMCSIRYQGINYPDATTEEIEKDLIKGRKENYEMVDFSGGEPTVRKDIFHLIKQASNLGYKGIGISTNGIKLHNRSFSDRLVKAGLTFVTFSLHAHNKKLNEIITRTPNSFEQTVKGIKNALRYENLNVYAATAIFKLNYQYILEIGKFIHSLGIYFWDIADLQPSGYVQESYDALCVNSTKLSDALCRLKPLLNDFQTITFFNFSPCIIPSNILNDKKTHYITFSQKFEVTKFKNYVGNISSADSIEKNLTDMQQKKIDICYDCIFTKECAGIWTEYLRLFGNKEIRELAVKHGCVKRNTEFY